MLRLGQFTDTFLPIVDGVGRVVYAYADTLCKMGHQVTVVAPMYDTGFQGGFPFELVDFMGAGLPGMKQYQIGEARPQPLHRRVGGAADRHPAEAAPRGHLPLQVLR